jgi:quercetin dioxygenase-like cupin family protein
LEGQDEWFFVLEGEFDFQVAEERLRLRVGDSVFAPRKIVHARACVSDKPGKMLIVSQPAGKMEEFFRALGKLKGPPSAEEAQRLFLDHGMKVGGPPLKID